MVRENRDSFTYIHEFVQEKREPLTIVMVRENSNDFLNILWHKKRHTHNLNNCSSKILLKRC